MTIEIVALRPNGWELERVPARADRIEVTAGEIRNRVRNDRGWEPTFRVMVDGRDDTALYRVNDRA